MNRLNNKNRLKLTVIASCLFSDTEIMIIEDICIGGTLSETIDLINDIYPLLDSDKQVIAAMYEDCNTY